MRRRTRNRLCRKGDARAGEAPAHEGPPACAVLCRPPHPGGITCRSAPGRRSRASPRVARPNVRGSRANREPTNRMRSPARGLGQRAGAGGGFAMGLGSARLEPPERARAPLSPQTRLLRGGKHSHRGRAVWVPRPGMWRNWMSRWPKGSMERALDGRSGVRRVKTGRTRERDHPLAAPPLRRWIGQGPCLCPLGRGLARGAGPPEAERASWRRQHVRGRVSMGRGQVAPRACAGPLPQRAVHACCPPPIRDDNCGDAQDAPFPPRVDRVRHVGQDRLIPDRHPSSIPVRETLSQAAPATQSGLVG